MKLINFLFTQIVFFSCLGGNILNANTEASEGWTTIDEGSDRERVAKYFTISYPNSFTIDPASGISPEPYAKGVQIPENNWHSFILHNSNNTLEVIVSPYGFLSEKLHTSRGFESMREVILTDLFSNALSMKITKTEHYDLFYEETEKGVLLVYLDRAADWGQCYYSLVFLFQNDTSLEDHKEVIEKIIASFVPSFARKD